MVRIWLNHTSVTCAAVEPITCIKAEHQLAFNNSDVCLASQLLALKHNCEVDLALVLQVHKAQMVQGYSQTAQHQRPSWQKRRLACVSAAALSAASRPC